MSKEEPAHSNPWPNYRRVLRYALRYRGHLLIGMVGGVLCGGSLFALLRMSPRVLEVTELNVVPAMAPAAGVTHVVPVAETPLPSWLKQAEKLAARYDIPLMKPNGRPTWQFVALGLFLVPVFVGGRLLALYLNQYCLRWLGARVVRDLRDELFDTLQNQSLRYHGNVDVGRLISRTVADTTVVNQVISTALAEASRAPFEILGALVFVILFARERQMFDLLVLVVVGFPACIMPLVLLGRRVRRWTWRSLERSRSA